MDCVPFTLKNGFIFQPQVEVSLTEWGSHFPAASVHYLITWSPWFQENYPDIPEKFHKTVSEKCAPYSMYFPKQLRIFSLDSFAQDLLNSFNFFSLLTFIQKRSLSKSWIIFLNPPIYFYSEPYLRVDSLRGLVMGASLDCWWLVLAR